MAMKPPNFEWSGFAKKQCKLLDAIDFYGNNGWARNPQSEIMMPKLLAECEQEHLSIEEVRRAMESIGYSERTTREIVRWERKRTTGKFGC